MNKKWMKQACIMILMVTLIVSNLWTDHSHAATAAANSSYEKVWTIEPPTETYTSKIGQTSAMTLSLDMWHYSGGYWRVGNDGSDKITVQDNDFKLKNISQMVANTTAEFTEGLPAEVKAELAKGNKVIVQIKPRTSVALNSMFDVNSLKFKISGNEMKFNAVPVFNFIDTRTLSYWNFVTDPMPNVIIPFVDPAYGYNIYSIFGQGINAVQANGWIDKKSPTSVEKMPQGRIHPSMVKDTSGALKSGSNIYLGAPLNKTVSSDGLSIGQGTFNNAGACGLHFEYPVEFIFYAAPNTPPEAECTACGDILKEGTTETKCSATSCKEWGKSGCGCTVINDPVGSIPAGTSGCSDVIKWSETKAHTYTHSPGCKTKKLAIGSTKRYCPGHSCTHIYTYQTSMTADATLNPTTFKSGYGFTINASSSITSTKQISNSGSCKQSLSKANDKKPTLPNKGDVRVGWTVKMTMKNKTKQTQPKIIALSHLGNGKFEAAPNKVSESKKKKIYVDVAVAGTKEKPKKHDVVIYISGGGVPGVAEFCKTITKQITINGNMHEDDYVH